MIPPALRNGATATFQKAPVLSSSIFHGAESKRGLDYQIHRPTLFSAPIIGCARHSIRACFMPPKFSVWRSLNKSTVGALLRSCCPSAVLRAIVAIYVHSFNGKGRLITGGFSPFCKRRIIRPFLANRNSTTAVITISRGALVRAACAHILPNTIKSGTRLAVGLIEFCYSHSAIAATRLRLSVAQVSPDNIALDAAITHAAPDSTATRAIAVLRNYAPLPKTLSSQLDYARVFCHAISFYGRIILAKKHPLEQPA